MVKFLTELKLIKLDESYYRLTEILYVQVDGTTFTIPKGFRTNLANTPKFLHGVLPPDDPRYITAAVVHDYLYSGGYHLSRSACDKIFYKIMRAEGNSVALSSVMFMCVRVFGKSHCYK